MIQMKYKNKFEYKDKIVNLIGDGDQPRIWTNKEIIDEINKDYPPQKKINTHEFGQVLRIIKKWKTFKRVAPKGGCTEYIFVKGDQDGRNRKKNKKKELKKWDDMGKVYQALIIGKTPAVYTEIFKIA